MRRICTDPARIAGLELLGLRDGAPAELCLFDPAATWTVDVNSLRSKGHNTTSHGQAMHGRVRLTPLGGHTVFTAPGLRGFA